jgi:hypothetical protein
MTNKEKWNKIVELHEQQRFSREDIVQNTWEMIFSELFGYAKLFGEIDVQRSIQIGSTERAITDIIIKDKDNDLFIVEVKQQTLDSGEKQLLSYLKLLHVDVGILVNNKITIFAYDYKKQDSEQVKYDIHFDRDSTDGELFVELFSKPFQTERAREFIIQKNSSSKHVQEIKKRINKDYIVNLLHIELSKTYAQMEIKEALKEIEITIGNKKHMHRAEEPIDRGPRTIKTTTENRTGIKIGQAVQNFFYKVSLENALSEELVHKLCDRNYCRQTFRITRPVLKEVFDLNKIDDYRKDNNGYGRYYRECYRYNGKSYILCSQWTIAQEPYFYEWKKFYEAKIIVK